MKQYFDKAFSKIAVLGSGTMGGQIAAHFANLGFDVVMFDTSEEALMKVARHDEKIETYAICQSFIASLIKTSTYENLDTLSNVIS